MRKWLDEFIPSKNQTFYRSTIYNLLERLRKVLRMIIFIKLYIYITLTQTLNFIKNSDKLIYTLDR